MLPPAPGAVDTAQAGMHASSITPASALIDPADLPLSPPPTRAHRWIDLGLVFLIATAPYIAVSIYHLFRPEPTVYRNTTLASGLLQESSALALFFVLYSRQGRKLSNIGFTFSWTDLPVGLGLFLCAMVAMYLAWDAMSGIWTVLGHGSIPTRETAGRFATVSPWLMIPFLLLNPFFEETLVRGYLMTEILQLRSSALLAVLISLAVQTSYHLYYGVFGALMVGAGLSVLAFYFAKARRLVPVIMAHLLWDLTALLQAWHR